MDELQEIKARISKLKGYENAKPTDQYWMAKEHIDFLIDRTELSVKQQEIIEENKRQQEVTVHQFRQAQEEIQRLTKENDRFRKAFHLFANMKTVRTAPELVIQSYSQYAKELLEGRGMEGDAE
ncbi:VWA domain-containing protein [Bacillus subtilis]|uniref:VWA domain-containing protein n=1 Tax=Bacillus subtilis TaxID=1423 RepID=UPI0039A58C6A